MFTYNTETGMSFDLNIYLTVRVISRSTQLWQYNWQDNHEETESSPGYHFEKLWKTIILCHFTNTNYLYSFTNHWWKRLSMLSMVPSVLIYTSLHTVCLSESSTWLLRDVKVKNDDTNKLYPKISSFYHNAVHGSKSSFMEPKGTNFQRRVQYHHHVFLPEKILLKATSKLQYLEWNHKKIIDVCYSFIWN